MHMYTHTQTHICICTHTKRAKTAIKVKHGNMLQCVAVCYGVLRCVCYGVLRCVAVCCDVLQCFVVFRIVLQCVAVCTKRAKDAIKFVRSGTRCTTRLVVYDISRQLLPSSGAPRLVTHPEHHETVKRDLQKRPMCIKKYPHG